MAALFNHGRFSNTLRQPSDRIADELRVFEQGRPQLRRTPGHTDTPSGSVSVRVLPRQAPLRTCRTLSGDVRTICVAHPSLHFFVERMMRFTTETDTPKVRAMVGAFRPASNDARTKFAFPSGISAILAASLDADTGRDAGGAAALSLPVEAPSFRLAISA
jgi:hypothetical protein